MRIADLLEALARGQIAPALDIFDSLYEAGADPIAVLQDLLEFTHWLTRLNAAPGDTQAGGAVSDLELERGRALAAGLTIPVLTRCWQILLKGASETQLAADPRQAAEMVLIRLAYAADLPTPAEIVRAVGGGERGEAQPPAKTARAEAPEAALPVPEDFEALVELFKSRKEMVLHAHLANDVGLVDYAPGRLRYRRGPHAPEGLESRVRRALDEWTGRRWSVEAVDGQDAAPSLRQQHEERAAMEHRRALDHPAVQAALEMFPGATVEGVRSVEAAPILGEAPQEPPTEADDDPDGEGDTGRTAAMKNFGQLMKQAQEMQSKIQDMQSRLAEIEVTGQSGAGLVTVIMNARNEVRRVGIDPSLFNAEDASVVEGPDRRRLHRRQGQGGEQGGGGNAEDRGRPQPAARPQPAVLRIAGPARDGPLRNRPADPAPGQASGARPALGAARGAAPDQAADRVARTARPGAGRGRGIDPQMRRLRQCRHRRSLRDLCPGGRATARRSAVVEDVADLWALERTAAFDGRYHVLGGTLSALDGRGPDELNIDALVRRAGEETVREVILATSATVEGQTTAHYLTDRLAGWRRDRLAARARRPGRGRARLSRRRHPVGGAEGAPPRRIVMRRG